MKRAQVNKQSDLPTKFSLEKYVAVRNFGLADWITNLEARFLLEQDRPYASGAWDLVQNCEHILAQPIFPAGEVRDGVAFSKVIEPLTVVDYQAEDLYWSAQEYMDGRFESFMGRPGELQVVKHVPVFPRPLNIPYHELLTGCGIRHDGDVIAKVNLHASDEKIKSDFIRWLAATRRATGISTTKKRYGKEDLAHWAKNAILPYLDLAMWARVNNVEITQQVLGVALFPGEFDVNLAERIRKVIAPIARDMQKAAFIDSLHAQVLEDRDLESRDEPPPER